MKKNININLFGTLYAIDEDACKLLEDYLDNIKSHFAKREGGDEIADDSLLKDYDWVASRKNQLFCEQSDSATWVDNVSKGNDNWHYLASKPFHHDGGTLEYRLRIGQHYVTDATVVGSEVWMAHETVRKQ